MHYTSLFFKQPEWLYFSTNKKMGTLAWVAGVAFTGLRVQILNHKEISLKNILKVYSLVKKAFVNFKYPFFELINPPRLIRV